MTAQLRSAFEANFTERGEAGAAVSLWQGEKEIASFQGGFADRRRTTPWSDSTLVLIWSATKGLAVSCVLHSLEKQGIELSEPVRSLWPEFGRHGKEAITLSQLLSHRSGLSALSGAPVSALDYEAVIHAVENQEPLWQPGEKHGYSPRLFGFLLDELIRRMNAGETLGAYWRRVFAIPMNLDIWIGLPELEHGRVAEMIPPKMGRREGEEKFEAALADRTSLTAQAFANPTGSGSISAINQPLWRSASIASFGGIAEVRSLARFYAMLASGGRWNGRSLIGPRFFKWAQTPLSAGTDAILHLPTTFNAGFMQNSAETQRFGPSRRAFGHPGAGGSLAFADPDSGFGFAYAMNQMGLGVLPGERALSLVRAIYSHA